MQQSLGGSGVDLWLVGGQARRRWEAGELLDPRAPIPAVTMHAADSGFQDLDLRPHVLLL